MRHRFCRWHAMPPHRAARCPVTLADWVIDTRSLTARLRQLCGEAFNVQLLDEGWRTPSLDEASRLSVDPRRQAWIREVALCRGDRHLVRARSVIPAASLRGRNRALARLGTRPLGELLFAGAGTRRDALEVARLRAGDWLTRRLAWDLAVSCRQPIWARRAVHWLNGRPLLVAEVFLPALREEADG